jgi:hypothetical protein
VRCSTFTFGALLLMMGVGACGVLAGLGDYAQGVGDSGVGVKIQGHPEESGILDDAMGTGPGGEDTSVGPASDDATDAGTGGSEDVIDTGSTQETADAGDAAQDAAALCRTQCSGCCDSNDVCHGGQSLATCGSGGAACVDCSTQTKVCSSAGSCVKASMMEAGPPPMCSVSNCKNSCPLLMAPCCKGDQTCGCAVLGLLLCN